MNLIANAYGKAKAARFRRRYGFDCFTGCDPEYADVHDYLHTLIGAQPTESEENDVLMAEASILDGLTPLPRGLEWTQ